MKNKFIFVLFLLIASTSIAQKNNISKLTVKQIMQADAFVGQLPSSIQWSGDAQTVYFKWNPQSTEASTQYKVNITKQVPETVNAKDEKELQIHSAVFNSDRSMKVYTQGGDLYLLNTKTNVVTTITQTVARESSPEFVLNDTKIAFNLDNNLYTWDIENGLIKQLSNFKKGNKPSSKKSTNERDEWLKNDQKAMFEVYQDDGQKKNRYGNRLHGASNNPAIIYLGNKSVMNMQLSPDGKFISYQLMERVSDKRTMVPKFVTKSGYTEEVNAHSKVGGVQSKFELHIYNIKTKKTYRVATKTLEGMQDKPAYYKDYPKKKYAKITDRTGYISGPFWNNNGESAFIEIKANDNKDRWIALLDFTDGSLDLLNRQHDDAWVDGPGVGWFSRYNISLGWMPDGKSVWFQSEVTGYSHLYTVNVKNKKIKALTKGDFEIYNPKLSKDKKSWYFSSNKVHPGELHFYVMSLDGGKSTQLTQLQGNNTVSLSPDEKWLAIRYSYSNKPWELYLMENPVHNKVAKAKQITDSPSEEFKAYPWREPQVITFEAADGATVHARLYLPETSVNNKAAVLFVHGAGYLQNAHKWWSTYYREYMFHNILVDNGYTVLDIDYRGSAGYGSKWRTGIYRHMGGKDLSDHVDGVKFLVAKHGVDPNKIGLYGGSYGGFITLMAMFNESKTFKAGAAIRSVTDWAHYNHGYTANILNTPVKDSLAYRRSSPIYFADGLKGDLLILHGMIDDNVHFQDVVRLAQRLIELEKEDWEMALYPVERHGFVEPSSWTDEYKRIFKLFDQSLLGN